MEPQAECWGKDQKSRRVPLGTTAFTDRALRKFGFPTQSVGWIEPSRAHLPSSKSETICSPGRKSWVTIPIRSSEPLQSLRENSALPMSVEQPAIGAPFGGDQHDSPARSPPRRAECWVGMGKVPESRSDEHRFSRALQGRHKPPAEPNPRAHRKRVQLTGRHLF